MRHLILNAGLAGAAVLAAIVVAVWAFMLVGLRRDAQVIRDAEALKSVDLSRVIVSHVPISQRTNDPDDEIRLAKEAVARKTRAGTRGLAAAVAVLLLLGGANVWLHLLRKPPEVVRQRPMSVEAALPKVDVLAVAAGTWGWKFNALLSCKENPHTMTVSQDRTKLSIRFRTPLPSRDGDVAGYDYDIVRTGPNELVLHLIDAAKKTDVMGRPLEWTMFFEDGNNYYLKRSDVATKDTGLITRCSG